MPTALIELPPELTPPRKRWTRADYEALASSGVFADEHLELVAGELISKMGKKRPHVNSLLRLQNWLASVFGALSVNAAAPIDVTAQENPTNEPEPDVIVLKRDLAFFPTSNPRPEDLHLVVEVSDTTLRFDLTTKAALYARACIVEYWVADLRDRRLIVHREPRDGRYQSVAVYGSEEFVAPLAAPGNALTVSSIFE